MPEVNGASLSAGLGLLGAGVLWLRARRGFEVNQPVVIFGGVMKDLTIGQILRLHATVLGVLLATAMPAFAGQITPVPEIDGASLSAGLWAAGRRRALASGAPAFEVNRHFGGATTMDALLKNGASLCGRLLRGDPRGGSRRVDAPAAHGERAGTSDGSATLA